MEKKKYIEPTVEVTELASEVIMNVGSDLGIIDDVLDSSKDEQYAYRRRGKWGDLWYKGE